MAAKSEAHIYLYVLISRPISGIDLACQLPCRLSHSLHGPMP